MTATLTQTSGNTKQDSGTVTRSLRARTGPSMVFAAPALLFFGFFALIPLVGVAALSLTNWDGISDISWAGLGNWIAAFDSPGAYRALGLSLHVMVLCWLVQTPISLLLGTFVATRGSYREVLGVLFFLPMLLSAAAIAITFKAMLDPNFGMSLAFGIEALAQNWLGDPSLALYVVIFVIAWQFVPFHTLLYQAGVRQIPTSLYEAATIDGAGRVQQFFHLTLPQLRYTIVTSSTLVLVGSLTYFDLVYVLTQGGPGNATRILPLDMYLTGFVANDMGRASVLAVLLVATGLTLSLGLARLASFRRGSQMEGA